MHSSILAWRIPWMRRMEGYSPWGCKESDTTEQLTLTRKIRSNTVGGRTTSVIFKIYTKSEEFKDAENRVCIFKIIKLWVRQVLIRPNILQEKLEKIYYEHINHSVH